MFLEKSVCFFNTISNFLHRTMQTAKFEVIEAYDLVSSFFRNGSMTACFAWQPRFFGSEILVAFCPRNEIPEEFVLLASTDRCSVTTDFCNRTSGAGTVQINLTAECRMSILACQGTRKAREVFLQQAKQMVARTFSVRVVFAIGFLPVFTVQMKCTRLTEMCLWAYAHS